VVDVLGGARQSADADHVTGVGLDEYLQAGMPRPSCSACRRSSLRPDRLPLTAPFEELEDDDSKPAENDRYPGGHGQEFRTTPGHPQPAFRGSSGE
jgi:hypothetical protein